MADETPKKTTEELITEALLKPSSISGDGVSISNRSVSELIAADKHLANKNAGRSPTMGVRFGVMRGPGHF